MLLDVNDAVHRSNADWLTSEIEQGRAWQHSRWRTQKEKNVKWKAQALAALDTFYCFKHLVLLQFSIWLCQLPIYCQHAGITEPIISSLFTVQEDQVHLQAVLQFTSTPAHPFIISIVSVCHWCLLSFVCWSLVDFLLPSGFPCKHSKSKEHQMVENKWWVSWQIF